MLGAYLAKFKKYLQFIRLIVINLRLKLYIISMMSWLCHTSIKNHTMRGKRRCISAWKTYRLIAYEEWQRTYNLVLTLESEKPIKKKGMV